MIEQKRDPFGIDHGSLASLVSKKHRGSLTVSNKERKEKEKLGEKIVALQQLVSPYGKTDTASVLSEATEYIQFLHEQVKVLSAPYLLVAPPAQDLELCSLRSRGLCLVPISCTAGVASANGADLWAPMKTTSPKFERPTSDFH
ncbi:hypothetical protein MLD38_012045 [Melastoma candidum]|uniref:Uncharacterized protein n=1 Tax=Melastoma candidum TaxID=119954 RepID=A0ACB9R552_9MYRT|nr:hypothetical protein MLD38_012045 [Melastoma candidum]